MRTLERLAEALAAKLVVGFERGGSLGDQTVPGKLQGASGLAERYG